MTSKTSICNKALRKLGSKPIINIDTDTSRQATLCKASYDDILEEVLRDHNWNFAITRQALVKDGSGTPLYGFSSRFILPTVPQFIKLVSIENSPEFKIENGFILANQDTLNIRYVGKILNTNQYDSIFINAFATRLASEIAFALTSDSSGNNLTQKLQQQYLVAISRAKDIDFQEDNPVAIVESRWNDARPTDFDRNNNIFTPIPVE